MFCSAFRQVLDGLLLLTSLLACLYCGMRVLLHYFRFLLSQRAESMGPYIIQTLILTLIAFMSGLILGAGTY